MLKNLIYPVIAGIVLFGLQLYMKDSPDATYSVSNALEIVGEQGRAEYAQVIEVMNSGNTLLKDISIKVPFHISHHKLTKHSSKIVEKIFSDDRSFEVFYPELPSKQKVTLLIRYDGYAMDKELISVIHADGSAIPIKAQSKSLDFIWIWLAFFAGVLSQGIGEFRAWNRKAFQKWASDDEIYRNKAPWYASSAEWPKMQYEVIEKSVAKYSYDKIELTPYYQLLNREKPTSLSQEQWSSLITVASKSLVERLSKELTRYSSVDTIVDLYKLKRPELLSQESWSAFQDSLKHELKNRLFSRYTTVAELISILDKKIQQINQFDDSIVSEVYELAQVKYCNALVKDTPYEAMVNPAAFILAIRFDQLSVSQLNTVMKAVGAAIGKCSFVDKLVDVFRINKAEPVSHESWSDFQGELKAQLYNLLFPKYMDIKGYEALLEVNNPVLNALPEVIAREVREDAQNRYSNYLKQPSTLNLLADPLSLLTKVKFELLTNVQAQSVREHIELSARLNAMPTTWTISELDHFVSKGRQQWMSEKEFGSISEFVSDAKKLENEKGVLSRRSSELSALSNEVEKIKSRVTAQLDMIDKVLTNPSAIDKVEDYDQTFAVGNRRNLELVASIIKQQVADKQR